MQVCVTETITYTVEESASSKLGAAELAQANANAELHPNEKVSERWFEVCAQDSELLNPTIYTEHDLTSKEKGEPLV